MNAETAPRTRGRNEVPGTGGQLVPFPASRAFGPLSWRTVRLASVVVLLLLLGGAILDLFLGRAARVESPAPRGEARVPS